jgi:hypothetical protein
MSEFDDPELELALSQLEEISSPSPSNFFKEMVFDSASDMLNSLKSYAKARGFKSFHKGKYNEKTLVITQFFCNNLDKTCATYTKGTTKTTCTFRLTMVRLPSSRYAVHPKAQFNLEHNHALIPVARSPFGKIIITREDDLEKEELEALLLYGADVGLSLLRTMMKSMFDDKEFDTNLLKNCRKKAIKIKYGDDPHNMNQLMALGKEINREGGLFDYVLDEDMRLQSLYIKFPTMDKYLQQYGDFFVLDGTHGTNAYGLTLIPLVIVEPLGKSIFVGIIICPAESSVYIIEGMKRLGIGKKNSVLLSDQGAAFGLVAEALEMTHRLCAWHFLNGCMSNTCGMSKDVANNFLRTCNELVYKNYHCKEVFYSKMDEALESFSCYEKGLKFLQGLSKVSEKLCYTIAGSVYTASSKASQRGESVNSIIKEQGQKKKELKTFSLFKVTYFVLTQFFLIGYLYIKINYSI